MKVSSCPTLTQLLAQILDTEAFLFDLYWHFQSLPNLESHPICSEWTDNTSWKVWHHRSSFRWAASATSFWTNRTRQIFRNWTELCISLSAEFQCSWVSSCRGFSCGWSCRELTAKFLLSRRTTLILCIFLAAAISSPECDGEFMWSKRRSEYWFFWTNKFSISLFYARREQFYNSVKFH